MVKVKALEDVVPAVFDNKEQAEAAIHELRRMGYDDADLGVLVPDPAHYHLMDNATKETIKGLWTGGIIGAPLGVLAGLGIVTLAFPPVGILGVGGALLFGGMEGALWGTYIGAQVGMSAEIRHLEDIEQRYEIPLEPNEILVVVVAGDESERVCKIMEQHGARCFWEKVAA